MSSWKKASKINQKTHRERHQPENRSHLGILEKKKDYKKRADDYNKKQALLKKLKLKALNKSPDEFYFHMINSKVVDGRHRDKKKEQDKDTPEQIMLMESKDLNYVSFRRTIEAKKITKMQSELHLVDAANQVKNNHTFFVDSKEDAKTFDLATRLNTHPALISRKTNRLKKDDLQKIVLPDIDEGTLRKIESQRLKSYSELKKRIDREKELTVVQNKLEVKKNLKKKIGVKGKKVKAATKESAAVYQWPYIRKR